MLTLGVDALSTSGGSGLRTRAFHRGFSQETRRSSPLSPNSSLSLSRRLGPSFIPPTSLFCKFRYHLSSSNRALSVCGDAGLEPSFRRRLGKPFSMPPTLPPATRANRCTAAQLNRAQPRTVVREWYHAGGLAAVHAQPSRGAACSSLFASHPHCAEQEARVPAAGSATAAAL